MKLCISMKMSASCGITNVTSLLNSSMSDFGTGRCSPNEFEEGDKINTTALYTILVIHGLAIVTANTLVLVLFKSNHFLRRRQNYILASLAASDLLAGAVTVPLVILCQKHFNFCVAMDTCTRFLAVSTILHLFAATIERYLKIVKPFLYNVYVTEGRSRKAMAAVWTLSFLTSTIQLTWIDVNASEERQQQIRRIELIYTSTCLVLFIIFPFIGIVLVHTLLMNAIRNESKTSRLLSVSRRSKRRNRHKAKERKAAIVLMVMTVNFVVGWFPYFIMSVFNDIINGEIDIPVGLSIFLLFLKLNTALVNPLMYTYFKADFNAALKSSFKKSSKLKLQFSQKSNSSLKKKRKESFIEQTELRTLQRFRMSEL